MKKSFGQHFLKDERIAKKIVGSADLHYLDLVVEVGPGEGALTHEIIKLVAEKNLILIEADRDLIPALEQNFYHTKIIKGDAAQISFDMLTTDYNWKFISNLPYNAGNAILMNVLSCKNPPKLAVVMLQKEVAQKIIAKPGDMGILSVAVQLYARTRKLFDVKPGSFLPPPEVMSSVLMLEPNQICSNPEAVIQLAKKGFSSRRKQLHRNLQEAGVAKSAEIQAALMSLGISKTARAQELSITHWVALYNLLY